MTDAREHSQHAHVFRPALFGARRAYWLDGGVLHWRIGNCRGHVAVADIVSMRLWMPDGAPACCQLTEASGRRHAITDRHWFGWSAQERPRWGRHQQRTATFQGLLFTLARRVQKANPQARFRCGPGRGAWIASWIAAVLLAMAVIAGAGLMIAQGRVSWPALGLMGLALFHAPKLGPVLRAGGDRPFDPESLHNVAPAPRWVDWRSP